MILRETIYETCEKCGTRRHVADAQHGCDQCGKVIPRGDYPLNFTVFRHELGDTTEYYCCSWSCTLALLKTVLESGGEFSFISLPTIDGKDMGTGKTGAEFLAAMREEADDGR